MKRQDVVRTAHTLRYLRARQIFARLRLRAQDLVARKVPATSRLLLLGNVKTGKQVGWPSDFVPVDARTPSLWPRFESLRQGRIELLGQPRARSDDWRAKDMPRLWRFHLHYWDWAWSLVLHEDQAVARSVFISLYTSWRRASPFPHGDAWSAYPVALRCWTLCGLYERLVRGTAISNLVEADIKMHAAFLVRNLERDLEGNHLIKDLKALVGAGVFLGDRRLMRQAFEDLLKQVNSQVLADGGHYERSPAYHCQVLGDLLDIRNLLAAVGDNAHRDLDKAIAAMRFWLSVMLLPDGTVPLFNDGFPVHEEQLAALGVTASHYQPLTLLGESGYAVLRSGRFHVVADVGAIGPDEQPGHGHADTLSYVCYLGQSPIVVDTGTSTYELGSKRDYERSSRAHSTVVIDKQDSSEVYGGFRVARRARAEVIATSVNGDRVSIKASHDGYMRLPSRARHARTWTLTASRLEIVDSLDGRSPFDAEIVTHLSPSIGLREMSSASARLASDAGELLLSVEGGPSSPRLDLSKRAHVSGGFGTLVASPTAIASLRASSHYCVRMSLLSSKTVGTEQCEMRSGSP